MTTTVRYLVMAMRRPGFDAAVIAPHRAFLEDLRTRGLLDMAGGFADGSGGAYVLRNIESLAQAQAIVATDPLVLQGASDLTVRAWHVH
ncbi:YciI family protein [Luteimonas sp. 100069]|uniref:YciI family protein n=1 Tax=Luteimonas sp. 100069 TaxID=2006109 RepID=UPI000F4D765D|nr:YciI family protein [Luteimonas sp. 100069]RPD85828.1 hypothetical protein EGK76_08405 [Luteimonas sp. 100069]